MFLKQKHVLFVVFLIVMLLLVVIILIVQHAFQVGYMQIIHLVQRVEMTLVILNLKDWFENILFLFLFKNKNKQYYNESL